MYMPSRKVRYSAHSTVLGTGLNIPPLGGKIKHVGNEIHVTDSSGKVVHKAKHDHKPAANKGKGGKSKRDEKQGWVAYAGWSNPDNNNPINYFATTWRVPANPGTDHSQVVFLFNSIEPPAGDAILQPVVQYGPSAAGGGSYWAVASWYVAGSQSYYSPLVTVSPGQVLNGLITLTGGSNGVYNYLSQFTNIGGSELYLDSSPELTWATETLEAYGTTERSDYPPGSTVFYGIYLTTTSGTPSVSWDTTSDIPDTLVTTVNVDGANDARITIAY